MLCNSLIFSNTAGRFTLSGNQIRFSGTTAGIVQNSANLQQINNALDLNAATTLGGNGAGVVTISGNITGSAGLTKNGSSTFLLTGNNNYGGGTTVNTGTLQIGSGSTGGSLGAAAIAVYGSLVFNRSNAYMVGNTISGTGSLVQNGTGTLMLTGTITRTAARSAWPRALFK